MTSSKKTSAATSASKIDPAFVPKARVLIKKIKAKLKQLNASASKKSAKKKSAAPASSAKSKKAKAA